MIIAQYKAAPSGSQLRANLVVGLSFAPTADRCQESLDAVNNASDVNERASIVNSMLSLNYVCRPLAWRALLALAVDRWQREGCR